MISLIKDLFTGMQQRYRRIKTESDLASFDNNEQFRLFEDISILNTNTGVAPADQLVYRFTSENDVRVFLRSINIWQGGRKYLVYPADGNETYSQDGEVDISDQIYPTSGILADYRDSFPSTGVTIHRKIGPNIFSSTSKARNGTAILTDGNANRASSSYTANGDKGGVGAGTGFYLVFNHIGAANNTLGLFLVAFEETFPGE